LGDLVKLCIEGEWGEGKTTVTRSVNRTDGRGEKRGVTSSKGNASQSRFVYMPAGHIQVHPTRLGTPF